ncbi:MAG: hypothetical protein ACFHWX_09175 [Bacteroidota bacterium]
MAGKLTCVFCLLLLILPLAGHSQQQVDITQFVKLLLADEAGDLTLSQMQISITDSKLKRNKGVYNYIAQDIPQSIDKQGLIAIKRPVILDNLTFTDHLYLNQFDFRGGLEIRNCQFNGLSIGQLSADEFIFYQNNSTNYVEILESTFERVEVSQNEITFGMILEGITASQVKIENNQVTNGEIDLLDSKINDGNLLIGDNSTQAIIVRGCDIKLSEYGEFNHYRLPGTPPGDLYLTGNTFSGDSTSRVILNKSSYLNLDIRENSFATKVYFAEISVSERFFLVSNDFQQTVSFEKFLFSEIWNELYWDQLDGYKIRYIEYGALKSEDFDNDITFKNLINIYKQMHSIFLSRGDLESANACYSEMKELQGQMLKHRYQQEMTFNSFLRWQLNVLLRIYTNHGTDPGLAVLMSFYVILLFSVFYVFFPSEWDAESKSRLLVSFEKAMNSKAKSIVGPVIVVGGSLLLTVVNALTLSINSFVTLGFGSVPTKGFARYLCIVEGFIGWFLLSIFTVALINQVLA